MQYLSSMTVKALIGCIGLYTILFLFIDKPVALAVQSLEGSNLFHFFQGLSMLAWGNLWDIGLPAMLIAIVTHDELKQKTAFSKACLYVTMSVLIAIAIGSALKYLLGRYRPIEFYEHGRYGFHYFATLWSMHSTPSGHTYRIFALCTALSLCQPRYRLIIMTLAVMVGLSRIIVHDHYPSDVLFGALIGSVSALYTRKYMYTHSNNIPDP